MEQEAAYAKTNRPIKPLLNQILATTTNFKGETSARGVLEHDDCGYMCFEKTRIKYLEHRKKGLEELFNELFSNKGDVGIFVKQSKTLAAFIDRPSVTMTPESFEVSSDVFKNLYKSTPTVKTNASPMSSLFKFKSTNRNSGLLEATGQCFACNPVERKDSEVKIVCPRLGRRRSLFLRPNTPSDMPVTTPVTASLSSRLLDRGVHIMLEAFKAEGLPRSPASCDYSSDVPEGFCCDFDDHEGWLLRPGLGQHAFKKNAGECVDIDDNSVQIPSGTDDRTYGYTCVMLGTSSYHHVTHTTSSNKLHRKINQDINGCSKRLALGVSVWIRTNISFNSSMGRRYAKEDEMMHSFVVKRSLRILKFVYSGAVSLMVTVGIN